MTNPAGTLQIDTTAPTVTSVTTSGTGITSGNGDLDAGDTVIFNANMSEAVTVTGGPPTMTLSDGGTATYVSGSGTSALTFSYTVQAGDNSADLAVTSFNPNSSTIQDGAGNNASMGGAVVNPVGTLQIDTMAPTVTSVTTSGTGITSGSGDRGVGATVTFTVHMSETVTVAGGTPTLTLSDGGIASYLSGTGTSGLAFVYTVEAGDSASDLTVTGLNLGTATIRDAAGNNADLSGAAANPAGTLQIDTVTPTVTSVATSGSGITAGTGDVGVGIVVTFTVNVSKAVTVAGSPPTLTLNDGGTATYVSGSGTSALAFSYAVGAGQNTSDLAVTTVNLNEATIQDVPGNIADISGAAGNPAGTLQVDTTAPTVTSVATSGTGITSGNGDLRAGATVTFTVNLSEVVTVAGGTPTLSLIDGGTATYAVRYAGTTALTFNYTVMAAARILTTWQSRRSIWARRPSGTAAGNNADTLRRDDQSAGDTCRSTPRRRLYRSSPRRRRATSPLRSSPAPPRRATPSR